MCRSGRAYPSILKAVLGASIGHKDYRCQKYREMGELRPSEMLTTRNKQAIDLYLSPDERYQGNGTACWMAVYGTKNRKTAAANWARMLGNARAQAYLEYRQREIDAERAKLISYEQADAVRDFLVVRNAAMQMVDRGRVVRKTKHKTESGKVIERVEYADVQGMLDPGEALRAVECAIRVQGKHPDQRAERAGVMVNIQIDTDWRGNPDAPEPIDVTETPDQPPVSEEEPPRAVIIGRK